MFRSDKTGHLCETPPNFAKGNILTNIALEEIVIVFFFIETPYILLAISLLRHKKKCPENYFKDGTVCTS